MFSAIPCSSAAQCLQTVSEDNQAVSSVILSTSALIDGLVKLVTSLPASESTISLRVMLACKWQEDIQAFLGADAEKI